ncbi:MAG: hypothetical protein Q8R51_05005 [Azonexus sp.]|nr:hypothetical protein [Azonexus sp.]
MELDIFIKETLIQIARGIQSANETLATAQKIDGAPENSKLYMLSPGHKHDQGNGIHFDVAITSNIEDEGKGSTKVKLAVVEIDLSGKLSTSEQAISRIQFSVTVNQWHG